ncbi:MAG: DNA translocase FtsK, partial [Verrucomicrobiales bacterium]|nr:DNA translocase FtsK [Verrucomicrobiales bacterium]
AAATAADDDPMQEEEEATQELPLDLDAPQPKIIDGTARRSDTTADGKKKPTLAELRDKRREKEQATAKKNSTTPSLLADAFRDYSLPDLDLLDFAAEEERKPADRSKLLETQNVIVKTLSTFGITVTPGDITRGPTITRYEIYPGEGLRVSRIVNLEADLARATKAERINIIAPIPGKDTVGIEIANIDKVAVPLRELLEDEVFTESKAKLPLALGKDVYGNTIVADLASMPHLLVAGATGSGKSVCINSIVASLLFQFSPDQLRFIMIDPKVVEMQSYNSLPHLVIPVVTDPKKVLLALRWVVNEMERRYKVFAQVGVRNFEAFNKRDSSKRKAAGSNKNPKTSPDLGDIPGSESPDPALAAEELHTCAVKLENGVENDHAGATDATPPPRGGEDGGDDFYNVPDSYPYIVVIIDELADLMQTAPADVEMAIARITQMARAAGIHLIVATQTPRADVITGVIKANIPCRIAFQVSSALDSRVILDTKGADKLVGKGDMLYLPPGTSQLVRSQGAFLSDEEIFDIVRHCSEQADPVFESDAQAIVEGNGNSDGENELSDEDEETIEKCLDVIAQEGKASTSLLQRRLRLGYTRAARMIDILENRGIIGPGDGARPREILVDLSDPIG